MSPPLMITVGLVGLVIPIGLILLLELGKHHFGSAAVGNSIAFTSFSLSLIVAAFECRSVTGSVFTTETFNSKQMNRVALGELVLAMLVTQMDALRRLLGTVQLDTKQLGWAFLPPLVLLGVWELGKLIARRRHA